MSGSAFHSPRRLLWLRVRQKGRSQELSGLFHMCAVIWAAARRLRSGAIINGGCVGFYMALWCVQQGVFWAPQLDADVLRCRLKPRRLAAAFRLAGQCPPALKAEASDLCPQPTNPTTSLNHTPRTSARRSAESCPKFHVRKALQGLNGNV